jgi:uncharacterized sulfatase
VGYRTLCVSENAYAGEAKGFDERFDRYVRSTASYDLFTPRFLPILARYATKMRSHGPGFSLDKRAHTEQNSYFTTEITKHQLRQLSNEAAPFFCYVHYNDPHHPYLPPKSHRNEFLDEISASYDEARSLVEEMHEDMYEWMADGLDVPDKDWEMIHALYDATIKYTDSCVGELFDFVTDRFEDTLVVITSDHGELLGEYGLIGHHIVLHDALIHVPLVTYNLDAATVHVDRPTQHIDVMQTLLSIAGAETQQFQGYDLRSSGRDRAISQDLRGTIEDDEKPDYQRIKQYNPEIDLSHLPQSTVTAVRTEAYKLVHTDQWEQLYQLPNECDDVSETNQSMFSELSSFVVEWLASEGQPFEAQTREAGLSAETREHLEEMGYL